MPSERLQRRMDSLLAQADEAIEKLDWRLVRERAQAVLAIDPENADALAYIATAERGQAAATAATPESQLTPAPASGGSPTPARVQPTSFVNGRYPVKRFLGRAARRKYIMPTISCWIET